MAPPRYDPEDLIVVIDHPMGRVETTLAEWMERGPGPRPFVQPIAVRSRSTGEDLPLAVIPIAYRNDEESRRLIAEGAIDSPW